MLEVRGEISEERTDLWASEFAGAPDEEMEGGGLVDGDVTGRPLGGISAVKGGGFFDDQRAGEDDGGAGVTVCSFEG